MPAAPAARARRQALGLGLHVAHLDHMIRSDRVTARRTTSRPSWRAWSLPATVEQADVPALARERRLELRGSARTARIRVSAYRGAGPGAGGGGGAPRQRPGRNRAAAPAAPAPAPGCAMRPAVEVAGVAAAGGDQDQNEDSGAQLVSAILDPRSSIPVPARLIRPLLGAERRDRSLHCARQGLALLPRSLRRRRPPRTHLPSARCPEYCPHGNALQHFIGNVGVTQRFGDIF